MCGVYFVLNLTKIIMGESLNHLPAHWQEMAVSLPRSNSRARHPQDAPYEPTYEKYWGESSAGNHMQIGAVNGVPSQMGTHFDTPRHYDENGETSVDRELVQGKAVVVDLRSQLLEFSDGFAITAEVVRNWLQKHLVDKHARIFRDREYFSRLLIRTLSDEQANKETSLAEFPYFANPEAVEALVDGVREATEQGVHLICVEPPSVDKVDQGCLVGSDAEGYGGAHGVLDERGGNYW